MFALIVKKVFRCFRIYLRVFRPLAAKTAKQFVAVINEKLKKTSEKLLFQGHFHDS